MDGQKSNSRSDHIISLMQKCQNCPWNPFKFSEIVILERCLAETSPEDPRISLLIKKLDEECFLVEPTKKQAYLSRDSKIKRAYLELMKQAEGLRLRLDNLSNKVKRYIEISKELEDDDQILGGQMEDINGLMNKTREQCEYTMNIFDLTLERTMVTFQRIHNILTAKIPAFITLIKDCPLIKQSDLLQDLYQKLLLQFAKAKLLSPSEEKMVSLEMKKRCVKYMGIYLEQIGHLFADLSLINEVREQDIKRESEAMKDLGELLVPLRGLQLRIPQGPMGIATTTKTTSTITIGQVDCELEYNLLPELPDPSTLMDSTLND